jgi:DNA-binding transcriptional LysR family regulator
MDLRTLDWDRLKIFQAVAECGSISAAATLLAVSQAKVSRDIEELEASFARELFLRSTRGMQLTALGADVLKSVRNMADSARAITARVTEAEPSTRVVIATQDAMATYWIARQLPDFLRANPTTDVMIKVVQDTASLSDGDVDISIQYEPPSAPNIISRQLGWLHYILYASPKYLAVHGTPETMFDLGRHRFMSLTAYNKQKDSWAAKTPHWGEVLSHAVLTNSSTVLLEACANDGGVAPMPSYVSEFEQRLLPLTSIPPLASLRVWLAYTERLRNFAQFGPVLDWVRDLFDPVKHACFRETYIAPVAPAAR